VLTAAAAAASVEDGRGSSERAQRRRPGGVSIEEVDDEDEEEECASSNISSRMLTNSGTKRIIDGCAKEQDDTADFKRSESGIALEERARAGVETDWRREGMNEEKNESTQDMSLMLSGGSDEGDVEVERKEEEEEEEEERVQQDVKADNSSATAERTMSDAWEQSKDAASTKGRHKPGAYACRCLMQAAASDKRFER
jgi:hypothetical protein